MTIDNMGWAGGQIHGDAPFTLNYLYVDLITHGLISVVRSYNIALRHRSLRLGQPLREQENCDHRWRLLVEHI